MEKPRAKKQKEFLQDMGKIHQELEWPDGFPTTPLRDSNTLIWKELDSELGDRILRIIVNEICTLVDRVGKMEEVG